MVNLKGKSHLIMIILAVIILVLVIGYYVFSQIIFPQKNLTTETPLESQQESSEEDLTELEIPINWKVYARKFENFTFKYPPEGKNIGGGLITEQEKETGRFASIDLKSIDGLFLTVNVTKPEKLKIEPLGEETANLGGHGWFVKFDEKDPNCNQDKITCQSTLTYLSIIDDFIVVFTFKTSNDTFDRNITDKIVQTFKLI